MEAPDITEERRLIESMGCAVAVWDHASLVIKYQKNGQRQQLISVLKPLGWTYPINDPGDAEAMLLDIRLAPPATSAVPLTLNSPFYWLYIVVFFCMLFAACGVFNLIQDIHRHAVFSGILAALTFLLIAVFIGYTGAQYATLTLTLAPREITVGNILKTVVLRVDNIKSCFIEIFSTFGLPFCTIIFIMEDGATHRIPSPYKGFENLRNELRKRYPFNVQG